MNLGSKLLTWVLKLLGYATLGLMGTFLSLLLFSILAIAYGVLAHGFPQF